MNVKNIDLLDLKKKIEVDIDLSNSDIETINNIMWGYNCYNSNDFYNIIMVLGNPNCVEQRLPKGLELSLVNKESFLLLSGGVYVSKYRSTEAEAMAKSAIEMGVHKKRILIENNSTTTIENIELSASVVNSLNIEFPLIAVVSSATHLRRVLMNFEQYKNIYPKEMKVIPVSSENIEICKKKWNKSSDLKETIAMELGYIHEYIYERKYNPFEI